VSAPRRYLRTGEVARLLNMHPDRFRRRRRALERELGFPPPAPGLGLRWDPAAIARWQDAVMPQLGDAPETAAAAEDLGVELARRAAALAGGPRLAVDNTACRALARDEPPEEE